MKALVGAFNKEKALVGALVGAFSVLTNLQMDLRFKLYSVSGQAVSRLLLPRVTLPPIVKWRDGDTAVTWS